MTTHETQTKPTRLSWGPRVLVGLACLTLVALLVSSVALDWRTFFPAPPRPPAPIYVCVYLSAQGTTTVTGSTPCATP